LQFAYLVSLYHHYHLLQQEHGKLEALELFSLAHRYSWIFCCQTLVAVTQEMAEKGRAIAKEQSREIVWFVFQPSLSKDFLLAFWDFNVFKWGL